MKKFVLFLALAFVVAGALCMGYSNDWVFDAIGAVLILGGGAVGTVQVAKRLKKRRLIVALVFLWAACVLLIAAGAASFSGRILLAVLGAASFTVYGFLIWRA